MKQRTARIQERASDFLDKLESIKRRFATPLKRAKTVQQIAVEKIQRQQQKKQVPLAKNQIKSKQPTKSKKTIQKVECFPVICPTDAERHKIPTAESIVAKFAKQVKENASSTKRKSKIIFSPASFICSSKYENHIVKKL